MSHRVYICHQKKKQVVPSRGSNNAWQLWSVRRNLDSNNIESHPRCLDTEPVRPRLHAVQMISAMLCGGGHMSIIDYDTSPDHSGTLHGKCQQFLSLLLSPAGF